MRKTPIVIFIAILIGVIAFILLTNKTEAPIVPGGEPTQTTPATKDDMIVLDYPLTKGEISSPLTVTGKARGNWYFEGSFPIMLVNWDGLIIAESYATAQGEWMTTDYVPFVGTIEFTKPDVQVSNRGWLILKKDNASGEPQFDNALEVEIRY